MQILSGVAAIQAGTEKFTRIGTGVDPEECGALLDDPRRYDKERDPDKAVRVSSLEESNDSVLERGVSLAESF